MTFYASLRDMSRGFRAQQRAVGTSTLRAYAPLQGEIVFAGFLSGQAWR